MARRSGIRWTRADTSRLSWAVRKFNAAIDAAIEADPEKAELLPDKLDYKDIRSKIDTRQDLKREMNKLERIHREGATDVIRNEQGVEATAYDINEVRIQVRTINVFRAKKRKELADIEATSRGNPLGYNIPTMGTEESNSYKPKKFNFGKLTKANWEAFKDGVEKMASPDYEAKRVALMMENYFKAIENVFGKNTVSEKLKSRIEELGVDKFFEIYMADSEAKFNYIYSKEDVERKLRDVVDAFGGIDIDDFGYLESDESVDFD